MAVSIRPSAGVAYGGDTGFKAIVDIVPDGREPLVLFEKLLEGSQDRLHVLVVVALRVGDPDDHPHCLVIVDGVDVKIDPSAVI